MSDILDANADFFTLAGIPYVRAFAVRAQCSVKWAENRRIAHGDFSMRWTGRTVIMAVIAAPLLGGHTHAGDSSPVSGREIYNAYCGACHGFNGPPLLQNAPDFAAGERMDKSDSELLDAIRAGKGTAMPAWTGILSDEDCVAVLQFIRETLS